MRAACVFGCAILLCGILAGCSGGAETASVPSAERGYRYAPTTVLGSARIESASKDISVQLPPGWRETVDTRNARSVILWMVREDYGASLSFTPMMMDPALYSALRKDGLTAVAKASLKLKRSNARDSVGVVLPPEIFTLRGRQCAAYEYTTDGGRTSVRVVVFDTGRRFIECALLPASPSITPAENHDLFELQQSVLASMVVK